MLRKTRTLPFYLIVFLLPAGCDAYYGKSGEDGDARDTVSDRAETVDAPEGVDGIDVSMDEDAPSDMDDPDLPDDAPVDTPLEDPPVEDASDTIEEEEIALPLVYPGAVWDTASPADMGLDASGLNSYRDFVGGRGCVVRGGVMVTTWGDQARRGDIASACKPFYTHFLFEAIEDGLLPSETAKVADHEPRLNDLNAGLGHKDRNIEWRHLANQISCYGVVEQPGAAYDYSDYNMALFFDTLFVNVYGSSWDSVDGEVFHPTLTDVIRCEDNPTLMAFGTGDRPGRVGISVRDFARFGLLYLRMGRWKDTQLLSAEHVLQITTSSLSNSIPRTSGSDAEMISGQRSIGGGNNQTDHMGSYSFAWWTNGVDRGGQRHWPDAPDDTYGAFGHGGPRVMVVIPSLDIVTSWNDASVDSREDENEALKRLVESVTD